MKRDRIVDLVFAADPAGGRRRFGLGVAVVLALYAGVFAFVSHLGSSLGPWGAEVAARVHDAIAMERARTTPTVFPRVPPRAKRKRETRWPVTPTDLPEGCHKS